MAELHDTMRREPDWPAPPHLIPLALRWHLLTNPAVMMGSFFFGLGIVFAMALGTNTGVLGTLGLAWDRAEVPGWLDQVTETQYEENEQRVYQYAYHFAIAGFILAAGMAMQFVLRRLKRREKAHAAGLLPARETSIECTYNFTLPDGRVIERKDQLRLPMGPEEEVPHLVLYDPRTPQNAVRLFGISPAVRLNPHGEWQADVNAGLAMIRLAFVLTCYAAGPLAGWYAKAAIGQ